jgi:hypothetical protein
LPRGDDPNELIIVSSNAPRKHPDLSTDDGRADVQATLDALETVFVGAVARNRGVTPAVVLSDFGQGGVFVGQAAVDAGMADRLGSFEATLAQMATTPQAHTPVAAQAAAASLVRLAAVPFSSPAPAPARPHTTRTLPKEYPMSDEQITPPEQNGHAPPPALPPVSDAAMQAQISAYVAQMEARYQAQQDAAFQRAQAEFERRIAEMEQRRQIEAFAQDATSATTRRPHAFSCSADELTTLLMETPPAVRGKWQGLITRTLDSGLVSFEEVGSEGGAADERDVADDWKAAVQKKRDAGLTQSAAIEAIKREQPDLFSAYNASGATVRRKGGK